MKNWLTNQFARFTAAIQDNPHTVGVATLAVTGSLLVPVIPVVSIVFGATAGVIGGVVLGMKYEGLSARIGNMIGTLAGYGAQALGADAPRKQIEYKP